METPEYDWRSPMWPDDPAVPVTVTAGDLHRWACQTHPVAFWLATPVVLSVLDADPTGTAATGGRAAPRPAPPRRTER